MLKRDLMKSYVIRIWFALVCMISCCLLVFFTKVHSAQQIDLRVDSNGESSDTHFILADNQDTNNPLTDETKNKKAKSQTWVPPPPPSDDFDWIQLTSGEWLKGDLKVLYENELEFDSDKMGLQQFDWEDVKQIRGHRVFSVRFVGPIIAIGFLQVTENKVFVTVGDEKLEFERNQLIAIAHGEPKEINYWSADISLGLNLSKGNTDQVEYNMKGNIKRRTTSTRFVLDYLGNFMSTDNVETTDNQKISSYFDVFKTRKYFFRPIFAQYYRDPFKNIRLRGTMGTGIGYHIINTSKTNWDIAVGPAYQYTRFVSVEPGQDSSESTPALVVNTSFNTELTKRLDLIADYKFNIVNEKSGRYNHNAIATLEAEITDLLDFDISFVWDRTENPKVRADGTVPKKDDFQLIFGVEVDF